MNDTTKVQLLVFGGLAIMAITTIGGAFLTVFGTPLDTSANDLGVAGIGAGVWHLLYYGSKGAIIGGVVGGLIWGLLAFLLFRNKNTKPQVIKGSAPLQPGNPVDDHTVDPKGS
jgi:hypothetical protein